MPETTELPPPPPDTAPPHPDSVNARLADELLANQQAIAEQWMSRVLRDAEINTEAIATWELQAHLPKLIEDLARALRFFGSEAVAEQTEQHAAKHGVRRWRQGYDLTELLREIAHLRTAFIYQLRQFEDTNPDFGTAARLFATVTVHRFLDDLATDAAEQFVKVDNAVTGRAEPDAGALGAAR